MPPNSNNYNKNFEEAYKKEQKMEGIVRKAIPDDVKEKLIEIEKLGSFITEVIKIYKNNKIDKQPRPLVSLKYHKYFTKDQVVPFQSEVIKQLNQMGGKRSTRRRHHKKRGTRKH